MTLLLTLIVQLGAAAALGVGLASPGTTRKRCGLALLAMAAAAAVATTFQTGTRTLEITHAFTGMLDGVNTGLKEFRVGEREADASIWPLLVAAWAGFWGALLALRPRMRLEPFWVLLFWAWSGLALHFGLELAAAPAALVRPVAFERVLYPVALTASFLLAWKHVKFFPTFFSLIVLVELCRLPLAVLGTLATYRRWNLSVDVHGTTDFVNPFSLQELVVTSGSDHQLAWLVWAPHLVLFPSFYVLSTGGIAFCTSMFLQYGEHGTKVGDTADATA